LKRGQDDTRHLKQPNGSGGIMLALHSYRQLLTLGEKGFVGQFTHGGQEPFYPPRQDGTQPKRLTDLRVDCQVLVTEEADVTTKWYFSFKDQTLMGFEVFPDRSDDPCEGYFYDYKLVDGRNLPHRFEDRYGNDR